MKTYVTNAVLNFFVDDWLLPNYNDNVIILIPKFQVADCVEQYRPIALLIFTVASVPFVQPSNKVISRVLYLQGLSFRLNNSHYLFL